MSVNPRERLIPPTAYHAACYAPAVRRSSVPVLFLVAIALALIGISDQSAPRAPRTESLPPPSPTAPPPRVVPWSPITAAPATAPVAGEFRTVARVVDGDTVELDDGTTVRYLGVDAPERHGRRGLAECFALEATKRNRDLVEGKRVRLGRDVSDTDRYGRRLRYVYVNSRLVNEVLLTEGYARSLDIPPDVRYRSRFRSAERAARSAKRGRWGKTCDRPTIYGTPAR